MNSKQPSQLTVKIYYLENGANKEIRKFSLDEEMVTNYEYLMGKIKLYFTSLFRKDLQLFWKDTDDDLIMVSSDEELFELLKTVQCDVDCLKLYIKVKASSPIPEPTGDLHPGIVCDGCDKNIIGVRYICTVCPNFDLCQVCDANGSHPVEHDMLRIKKPKQTPSFHIPSPIISVQSSLNGGPWKTHTPQNGGVETKESRRESFSSTTSSTFPARPPQVPPMFHPPPPPPLPPFGAPFTPQQMSSFSFNPSVASGCAATAVHSLFNPTMTSSRSQTTSSNTTQQAVPPPPPNPFSNPQFAQNIAQNFAANAAGMSEMADQIAQSVSQQFTNNPEFVNQLMTPLFPGTTDPSKTNNNSSGKENNNNNNNNNNEKSPEQMARNLAQSFASNPEFINGVMNSFLTQQQPTQAQQQNGPQPAHAPQAQQQQQQPPSEPMKCDVEEPVILDVETQVDETSSRLKYDPALKKYVVVEKTKNPPVESEYERNLNEALNRMLSMGFDNENGWLKQLLISKNLDIGRVLDAMGKNQM